MVENTKAILKFGIWGTLTLGKEAWRGFGDGIKLFRLGVGSGIRLGREIKEAAKATRVGLPN